MMRRRAVGIPNSNRAELGGAILILVETEEICVCEVGHHEVVGSAIVDVAEEDADGIVVLCTTSLGDALKDVLRVHEEAVGFTSGQGIEGADDVTR